MEMEFSLSNPEDEDCKCCYKVSAIQMVGVFNTSTGKPVKAAGVGSVARNSRTSEEGWRLDWPSDLDPSPYPYAPVQDDTNPDVHLPHYPNMAPGIFNDPPALRGSKRRFVAYTCFLCDRGSDYKSLGCLKWGFVVNESARHGSPNSNREPRSGDWEVLPNTPEWTCEKPEGWDGAVSAWNEKYDNGVPTIAFE
jgi:hypothetical protein